MVHLEALKEQCSTIIVLAEGIERFKINSELKNFWDWDNVLVISEFEPNSNWTVYNAIKRNKTIISLSKAMIVIEAGEKGGTFNAGDSTLKMKKPLFVVEYFNQHENNKGNELLIKKGGEKLKKMRSSNKIDIKKFKERLKKYQLSLSQKEQLELI